MEQFRFRKEEGKVIGAGSYSVDNDDIGNLIYTGLYKGDEIVALLVTEWDGEGKERLYANGDLIVKAVNSHDQLVAALRLAKQEMDYQRAQRSLTRIDRDRMDVLAANFESALAATEAA